MHSDLRILYEDNHLLAVDKPPGVVTQGAAPGDDSLFEAARTSIKERYQKRGNVYLGVVSRLDKPVTGVVLFARTSKAARRLSQQFRERSVHKTYWALISSGLAQPAGTLEHWLLSDPDRPGTRVVKPQTPGAKLARLSYRRLVQLGSAWLVEIELETGRKHQIRAQFAASGQPILGDTRYGSRASAPAGIGLHARQLIVEHPVRQEPVEITAAVPSWWQQLGVRD